MGLFICEGGRGAGRRSGLEADWDLPGDKERGGGGALTRSEALLTAFSAGKGSSSVAQHESWLGRGELARDDDGSTDRDSRIGVGEAGTCPGSCCLGE